MFRYSRSMQRKSAQSVCVGVLEVGEPFRAPPARLTAEPIFTEPGNRVADDPRSLPTKDR
jgi:hypothetical protein